MADRPDPNGPIPWREQGPGEYVPGQQPYGEQSGQGPGDQGPDTSGWTQTEAGWSGQQQGWDGGPQGWSGQESGWVQPGYQQRTPQGYQPGYGAVEYGPEGYGQQSYGRQPAERKSKAGWLIGAGVVTVLALGGGLAYWLTAGSETVDGVAAANSGAMVPQDEVAAISPCSSPPKMTGTSATQTGAGLSVSATLTAACPGGDVLFNNAFEVAVTANGSDVAAGSFDLSTDPIVLQKNQSAQVKFVFPADSYWRTADMATGELALTGTLAGTSGNEPETAVQNPMSLTATKPGTPASGSADSAAFAALEDIKAADAATLGGLQGQWLPQISSKNVGLFADGITWDNQSILREFLDNRALHPEALLLWSGDWGSFDSPVPYWVTVVGTPSSTSGAALSWCVANGLDKEHCLAKIVNRSGGSSGTTKHQPR